MEQITTEFEDIKILCFSEHWKSEEELSCYKINNFTLISNYCRNSGEHGGVAIYVKEGFKAIETKNLCKYSVKGQFECAAIEFKLNKVIISCIAVYSDGNLEVMIRQLTIILEKINEHSQVIILGDFNIDMMQNTKKRNDWLNFLNCYGIFQTVFEPTRITPTTATCIDGIYISVDQDYSTKVLQTHVSDHSAQLITFNAKRTMENFVYRRTLSEENIKKFETSLKTQDWQTVYSIQSDKVNEQYNLFSQIVMTNLNSTCPIIRRPLKSRTKRMDMEPESIEIKKKLDVLLLLKSKDDRFKNAYKEVKTQYDFLLRQQKSKSIEKKIENSDNKSKTVWSIVNSLRKGNQTNYFPLKGDPKIVANEMNAFFTQTALDLVSKHCGSGEKTGTVPKINMNESIHINSLSREQIVEMIDSLKNKQTRGVDEISNNLIKKIKNEIKEPLAFIINNSLKYGIFPEALKIAVVKPIHKKGSINDYQNYRPISLLPSFSKIFELAYCNQIMGHLIKNNVFSNSQHGYLRGRSVQTAIFDFLVKITEAFEQKNLALGLFLDLTKAYDCLSVEVLLKKMHNYGITGSALEWVRSYFSRRIQLVEIAVNNDRIRSEPMEMCLGVPQGSIAGPIFFIIYINDFGEDIPCRNRVSQVNYADDSNLLIVENMWPELKILTEEVLQYCEWWFYQNNLIKNKEKTNIVLFHPTNSNILPPKDVMLQDMRYSISESSKFLGLHIDKELKWNHHIEQLASKIGQSIYSFKIISKYVTDSILKTVYHATIESKLRFGISFYGSGNISSLFILQKKAIRIICKLRYDQSCRGFFKQKGVLTIYALYIQECLLFLHKNKQLFKQYENSKMRYDTRTLCYNLPKCKLTTTQKQMEYRCLKMFNTLPDEIQGEHNFKLFKRKLFKFLLNKEPYCMDDYMIG